MAYSPPRIPFAVPCYENLGCDIRHKTWGEGGLPTTELQLWGFEVMKMPAKMMK